MEKEIINNSKKDRKVLSMFNQQRKTTKDNVELDIPTITITKIFNQLVFMGNENIIADLSAETKEGLTDIFEASEKTQNFVSTYQPILPKLYADLRLMDTIWTAKMMEAQAVIYFCILGFGAGGCRYINSCSWSSSSSWFQSWSWSWSWSCCWSFSWSCSCSCPHTFPCPGHFVTRRSPTFGNFWTWNGTSTPIPVTPRW